MTATLKDVAIFDALLDTLEASTNVKSYFDSVVAVYSGDAVPDIPENKTPCLAVEFVGMEHALEDMAISNEACRAEYAAHIVLRLNNRAPVDIERRMLEAISGVRLALAADPSLGDVAVYAYGTQVSRTAINAARVTIQIDYRKQVTTGG